MYARTTATIFFSLLAACHAGQDSVDAAALGQDAGEEEVQPSCPHEDPSSIFTGGFVHLYSVVPEGGTYVLEPEGARYTREEGTIDWEAGTWSSEFTWIEDHTIIGSSSGGTFTFSMDGDWSAEMATTTSYRDGTEILVEESKVKTGCVTSAYMEDDGYVGSIVTTLVAPDRYEWVSDSGPLDGEEGVFFHSEGESTDDWTQTYEFYSDAVESEPSPDREGSCTNFGTGITECEMIQYSDDGSWHDHYQLWENNGDSFDEWKYYHPDAVVDPLSWGVTRGWYMGGGTRDWYTVQDDGVTILYCHEEWEEEGGGWWECDNGTSGTY